MPPPRAVSAEPRPSSSPQSAEALGTVLQAFLDQHRSGAVLEDGKTVFDLGTAQFRVAAQGDRCVLELWNGERTLVRTVTGAQPRGDTLRLLTHRFGQAQPRALTLVPDPQRREPNRREPARQAYLRRLQRVLQRAYPDWQPEAFRAAMDLERSFGPAYIRGLQVRGGEAWAVIGVSAAESQTLIDGILTLGILWLHECRERSDGRRQVRGLRLVLPRGTATLTLARLPWMNVAAAQWELLELDEATEELCPRDPADQGNLRTRLIHHPDPFAARERFAPALEAVRALLPPGGTERLEERLRSPAELAFLLHGLEFARARLSFAANRFAHTLEITVGVGAAETVLTADNSDELRLLVADLFARRCADPAQGTRSLRPHTPGRGIGAFTGRPAHQRTPQEASAVHAASRPTTAWQERGGRAARQQDPLYRAMPERWLESVLRENLAPLTRNLAPAPSEPRTDRLRSSGQPAPDPDGIGNRAEPDDPWALRPLRTRVSDRLIPRFDPRFVYTQVPAIAGASDRGMLDLLGMTADGRLAVIEVKAADDLQLALQGLDYWVRVRHHHTTEATPANGTPMASAGSDLQQHGYFCGVELSPLPPRLYLVAPALHVHPATETILRYLSPRVEWTLLALDERWRQEIRVVWRKSGGRPAVETPDLRS